MLKEIGTDFLIQPALERDNRNTSFSCHVKGDTRETGEEVTQPFCFLLLILQGYISLSYKPCVCYCISVSIAMNVVLLKS